MKTFKVVVNGRDIIFAASCREVAEPLAAQAGIDLNRKRGWGETEKLVEVPNGHAHAYELKELTRMVKAAQGELENYDRFMRITARP